MTATCHIIGSRRLGGAERFFVRLCGALDRRDHRTHAILRPGSELAPLLGDRIACGEAAMRGVWDLPSRWRIRSLIQSMDVPVVMSYMGRATRLTHLEQLPEVAHIARLGGYYDVAGYRHADAWVGNTRGICDHLIRANLPADRVYHISNFVDPAQPAEEASLRSLRESLAVPDDAWLVIGAGRMHRNKAFDILIEAMSLLPVEVGGRPVHLLLLGNGPEHAALVQLAESLDVSSRVFFAGWQADPAMYLKLGDLFVCPSRHEPLGNVILEAWSEGLPVLASRSDGPVELITADVDGVLVEKEDAVALANAIEALLGEDASTLEALARCGRETLHARHGEAAVVDAYLSLFETLAVQR